MNLGLLILAAILAGILLSFLFRPTSHKTNVDLDLGELLKVGDRVFVYGGYYMIPEWLNGNDGYWGSIEHFIPRADNTPVALVRLEKTITSGEVSGNRVVLSLRHTGATWRSGVNVHVLLYEVEPSLESWPREHEGKWIESAATIRLASDMPAE